MKKIISLILFISIFCSQALALIKVDITRGNLDPLPIAVSPLYVEPGSKAVKIQGKVIEDIEQITMGQQTISIKFYTDYVISSRLNIKVFYDKVITNPFISTTYPGSITNAGFSLRFSLAG